MESSKAGKSLAIEFRLYLTAFLTFGWWQLGVCLYVPMNSGNGRKDVQSYTEEDSKLLSLTHDFQPRSINLCSHGFREFPLTFSSLDYVKEHTIIKSNQIPLDK